ncbi:helix-turn-helix domain-containing protein [Halalkalibacter akibai]|uniref:Transcriptional regulator n=1 Tax=Halalkalibacter akibai (strain ATCC 43226 / DSM 21942 / CIP 109018 / JCM 9157 / 1139) TaxID=1236973 RepID=W4QW67_HALA3|nr:helix-turn-helix domain-containing protein [Halalkalibacter akibai]GAE36380.1 transcriptional regulator [Halalkalibacter akibai JCM 9157]
MFVISDTEELQMTFRVLYDTFEIPIQLLDNNGNVLWKYPIDFTPSPVLATSACHNAFHVPIIHSTDTLENYFFIHLNKPLKGTVIVGPSVYSKLSEDHLLSLINDLPITNTNRFIGYYQSLPVLNKQKLIQTSALFYFVLFKRHLDVETIMKQNKMLEPCIPPEQTALSLSEKRQNVTFHYGRCFEKKLLQAIKDGKKDQVLNCLLNLPENGSFGTLSKKSFVRNQKNICIAAITLATRAAMEGGVNPELAYTLSDLFIQSLEEFKEIKDIEKLMENALCTFAERVAEEKGQTYSIAVTTCQNYIFKHLYEEITLKDLSDLVDLNPCYLSVLFKKEVGISLTEFIQKSKIEEAKNLLTLTNDSLTEIYAWLNFTDQSYFTKIFKKFTGLTPKQYRILHSVHT